MEYWKGSSIPVYLFWVKDRDELPGLNKDMLGPDINVPLLQCKRYTPIIHGNKEKKMKKFAQFSKRNFLRDLMVDYARCLYKRGMTTVIEKVDFIELDKATVPLGDHCLFIRDVIPNEYKKEIIENSWTNLLATASSLAVSSLKPTLELALKNIELAKEMFNMSNKSNIRYSGFKKVIEDIEQKIIKQLSGKNNVGC